jgi:oligopeptide/dipeptide ABC transporter ATP-binding protein
MAPVLSVRDLQVRLGGARIVNGLSYEVDAGETVAIVGESGSGKTISALALLGLVPPSTVVSGEVRFDGTDLVSATPARLRSIRGGGIAIVFQDPMTSLNPALTVGRQITEGMEEHLGLSKRAARERAVELLDRVGIPDPRRRLDEYPHRLSGGMRQRVMIAIGVAAQPRVLIADEATTALDVTIQAQIVELIGRLQQELGMAVIWITHDLGVVAGIADRLLVMYAGRVVEEGVVDAVFDAPQHPYTRGLLRSVPVLGTHDQDLHSIPGVPPDPAALPEGCPFWPRCEVRRDERCRTEVPPLREVAPSHLVATFDQEAT